MNLRKSTVRVACTLVVALWVTSGAGARSWHPVDDFIFDDSLDIEYDEESPAPTTIASARPVGTSNVFARALSYLRAGLGFSRGRSIRPNVRSGVWAPRGTRAKATTTMGAAVPTSAFVRRAVTGSLGCEFSIEDPNMGIWDLTYEIRVKDPNDDQIGYYTNWASDKSSFNSSYLVPVSDPIEGEYTCEIQWYVDSYQAPLQFAYFNLSYPVPSGETSGSLGWGTATGLATSYMWKVTLTGGAGITFKGRIVWESFGGSVSDTCFFEESNVDEITSTNAGLGTTWQVKTDNSLQGIGGEAYDGDWVGWNENSVTYYRGGAGGRDQTNCEYTVTQNMTINRPGNIDYTYVSGNLLGGGILIDKVTSQRAGQNRERNW